MPTPIPTLKSSNAATKALVDLWTITLTVFIVGTLYLARDLLIPLTLAALLTFLLAPLVVMGRHIPRLSFLSVLLSDEQALTPAERDALAGTMLVQLLRQQGIVAHSAPTKLEVGELIDLVEKADVGVVCISVVAPSTVLHARYLCLKLRARLPEQRIVVGLWGATENVTDAARRVRDSGADEVVTTLADALRQLARRAPPQVEGLTPVGLYPIAAPVIPS